jgi:hypothetical protein
MGKVREEDADWKTWIFAGSSRRQLIYTLHISILSIDEKKLGTNLNPTQEMAAGTSCVPWLR